MAVKNPAARGSADANQASIVDALELVGATVVDLHRVGCGCADLLVGYHGRNYLMEVKNLHRSLSKGQVKFHADWRGQIAVVRTVRDALGILGIQ